MITIENTQNRTRRSPIFSQFILFSLIIIFIGITGYIYYQYQKVTTKSRNSQITSQAEVIKIAGDVGKLIVLPTDETPTIATVTDIQKLKNQPFFKNATNGNVVLIYTISKLAIIYDKKRNIIVNVGPVNFSAKQSEKAQASSKIRVGLRNGTKTPGIMLKMELNLLSAFSDIEVVLKDQDKRTDYERSIVVALNKSSKEVANTIAKALNSQIAPLPSGEFPPIGVDILIILGKDKI